MLTLVDAWDAALEAEPDDWSHATVELVLSDPERMEEAALLICAANPWHGETWRTGILRFRVARTFGYGASAQLVRGLLGRFETVPRSTGSSASSRRSTPCCRCPRRARRSSGA